MWWAEDILARAWTTWIVEPRTVRRARTAFIFVNARARSERVCGFMRSRVEVGRSCRFGCMICVVNPTAPKICTAFLEFGPTPLPSIAT